MNRELDAKAAARAIKYAGALGGLSRAETNEMLRSVGLDQLPDSSFTMILRNEVPAFQETQRLLGTCIRHPKSAADLSKLRQEEQG